MTRRIAAILALLLGAAALAAEKPALRDASPHEKEQLLKELKPTLDRIARGERNPHRNDGSVFGNRERLLPIKPRGYYREYVHPTPGVSHAGARRIVTGKAGEVYYTADHYQSFVRLR
jgi:guanyl-specific ribonuclease Sa